MALGDPYITLAALKNYVGIPDADTQDDDEITTALASISRELEKCCHRQFNDAGTTSARVYYPTGAGLLKVDDFSTAQGLVVAVDQDDDGVFETVWSAGDYQLEPLNGVVDGEKGWPFWRIRAVGGRCFPTRNRRASAQITARWGWAAAPAPIIQSAKIAGSECLKLKDAPFGVANMDQYGPIRVRQNPMIAAKWKPYVRDAILVG
jgi:hypothetical protein